MTTALAALALLAAESWIVVAHTPAEAGALAERGDLVLRHRIQVVPALVADLTPAQVAALRLDPRVRSLVADARVTVHASQEAAIWNLDRVDQAENAPDGTYHYDATGAGVRAYVLDSGIRSTHEELAGRVAGGISLVEDALGTGDCAGHGTHVAGTIGGRDSGVAKEVTLVPVRVFGCDGGTTLSAILRGVDWIAQNAQRPAVVNFSAGGARSTVIDEAFAALVAQGLTVVVSAGNSNADACDASPARVPEVITVGATDRFDERASFSNYGECVDLFAPGEDIRSADGDADRGTTRKSGTSMAAPHVAGAAALLLERFSEASGEEIRDRLVAAAVPAVRKEGPRSTTALLQTRATADLELNGGCSVAPRGAGRSPLGLGLLTLAVALLASRRR